MIGGKLHSNAQKRREPAQTCVGGNNRLAHCTRRCSVGPVGRPKMIAHRLTKKLRTPSLRGWVKCYPIDLPASFFAAAVRHRSAHRGGLIRFDLPNPSILRFLSAYKNEQTKGETKCTVSVSSPLLQPVVALWPVATHWNSRRLSVVGPVRPQPSSSMVTRCWVPRQAPQATSSIASNTQAAVDHAGATAGQNTDILTSRRLGAGGSYNAQFTAQGKTAPCGVLRFPNTKTKDTTCSKRS